MPVRADRQLGMRNLAARVASIRTRRKGRAASSGSRPARQAYCSDFRPAGWIGSGTSTAATSATRRGQLRPELGGRG